METRGWPNCVHGLPDPVYHCTEIEAGRGHEPRWRFAGGSSKLAPLTGCLAIEAAVVEAVGGAAAMTAGAGCLQMMQTDISCRQCKEETDHDEFALSTSTACCLQARCLEAALVVVAPKLAVAVVVAA